MPDPVITGKDDTNRIGRLLTPLFSLANVTAISVPCGFTAGGLPIGLQLAAKPFQEATVLNAAYAYEQATSVAHQAAAQRVTCSPAYADQSWRRICPRAGLRDPANRLSSSPWTRFSLCTMPSTRSWTRRGAYAPGYSRP